MVAPEYGRNCHAINAVHKEAHGLVADEIYPVTEHDWVVQTVSAGSAAAVMPSPR